MDTPRQATNATEFVLLGMAGSLGLFSLLRLEWTAAHVLLPLTRAQAALAAVVVGPPSSPIVATLDCSGADAFALCLGVVLAYPVPWRRRLVGAAGGTVLILGLNTLRIGTLGRAASSPAWFDLLHTYAWPAALSLAIVGYVFAWMRLADRQSVIAIADDAPGPHRRTAGLQPSRRFVILTAAFLLVSFVTTPFYLESQSLLVLGRFIAHSAAATLGLLGITAHAAANVLWTSDGGFLVTPECIATPLIPVYLAAVCAYAPGWRYGLAGALAVVPLFTGLAILRLMAVVVPGVMASPTVLVHAFYQLVVAAVIVSLAARWRHAGRSAVGHALLGALVGLLFVSLLGPSYTRLIVPHGAGALDDPQGALAFLPCFQIGLYLALSVATFPAVSWVRLLAGLVVLVLTQVVGVIGLEALASQSGLTAHVRDVRAWAIVGPVLAFTAVIAHAAPRR